jgi:hypothetical protein
MDDLAVGLQRQQEAFADRYFQNVTTIRHDLSVVAAVVYSVHKESD